MFLKVIPIIISSPLLLLLLCSICVRCDGEINEQDDRIFSQNDTLIVGKNLQDTEKGVNTTGLDNVTHVYISEKNNGSNVTNSTAYVSCMLNKAYLGQQVEIINASKLATLVHVVFTEPNITFRQIPGNCVIVMFYSPSCPFSCMAAPHFNALPRFFPDLKIVAFDAVKYRSISAQFGIIGTPTLILFHNRKPVAKFNDTSEYELEFFSSFITKYTGIRPEGELSVSSQDFKGPISSVPIEESDFCLKLSLFVIGAHLLYFFYYSTWGRNLVDATLNAWREAEAQHHQNNQRHHHSD